MDIICNLVIGAWNFLNARTVPRDPPRLIRYYFGTIPKGRAFTGRAFDPDAAVMKIDNAFGDGQTDTGSHRAAFGRVFYLMKGFKDFVQIFRFDANPVVFDLNQQMGGFGPQANRYAAAIDLAKFDRI